MEALYLYKERSMVRSGTALLASEAKRNSKTDSKLWNERSRDATRVRTNDSQWEGREEQSTRSEAVQNTSEEQKRRVGQRPEVGPRLDENV